MTLGRIGGRAAVVAVLLFLALPILLIVVLSFSSATYLTFPPPAFGVRWYRAYLGSAEWLGATWLSLWVAACVVVLATVLGTLAALGLARLPPIAAHRGRGTDPVAADRAGDHRCDWRLLRVLALRPGRHAGRTGAGAHLSRGSLRGHQRRCQPGRLRSAVGAGGAVASARRPGVRSAR